GDNVDGETNIITKMNPNLLKTGYRYILDTIYSAKEYTERVMSFVREFNPKHHTVTLQWQEIAALFRSIFEIGIRGKERRYYWKLFFWSLFKHPAKFPLAITFSIYGYHFRKVNELRVVGA
ncbi:MAG: DUF4070 domain-containing protein, partial [Chloroflexota bacterium]